VLVVGRSSSDGERVGEHKSSRHSSVRVSNLWLVRLKRDRKRERLTFKSFTIASAGKRIGKATFNDCRFQSLIMI
jgi:hypothetical protein